VQQPSHGLHSCSQAKAAIQGWPQVSADHTILLQASISLSMASAGKASPGCCLGPPLTANNAPAICTGSRQASARLVCGATAEAQPTSMYDRPQLYDDAFSYRDFTAEVSSAMSGSWLAVCSLHAVASAKCLCCEGGHDAQMHNCCNQRRQSCACTSNAKCTVQQPYSTVPNAAACATVCADGMSRCCAAAGQIPAGRIPAACCRCQQAQHSAGAGVGCHVFSVLSRCILCSPAVPLTSICIQCILGKCLASTISMAGLRLES
jgi:hypothetical protein